MTTELSAAERVTCPVCARPGRALTSTGRIKQHNVPPGPFREQIMAANLGWPMCPASRHTVEQAAGMEIARLVTGQPRDGVI